MENNDRHIRENIDAFEKITLDENVKKKIIAAHSESAPQTVRKSFFRTTAFRVAATAAACLVLVTAVTVAALSGAFGLLPLASKKSEAAGSSATETDVNKTPDKIITSASKGDGYYEGTVEKDEVYDPTSPIPKEDMGTVTDDEPFNETEKPSHLLTALEVNDTDKYDAFLNDTVKKRPELYTLWQLLPNDSRITVTVTDSEGKPAFNVKVAGLDANGKVISASRTDISGKAYLFANTALIASGNGAYAPNDTITSVNANGVTADTANANGNVSITLPAPAESVKKLDLMLICDTTGSMGDELSYLQSELNSIIKRVTEQANIGVRLSVNFYRDDGDEYVMKNNGFTSDITSALTVLRSQDANGGGDTPEVPDRALLAGMKSDWDDDAVKLCIIVLDAPPHTPDGNNRVNENVAEAVASATEQGIRIIPVLASGADASTESLMRSLAALTGGTTAFLTDNSGIGGSHIDPDVAEKPQSEYLDDMLVRIISSYIYTK